MKSRFPVVISLCILVHMAALLMMGVYEANGGSLEYPKLSNWVWFSTGLKRLNWLDIVRAAQPLDFLMLISMLFGLWLTRPKSTGVGSKLCEWFFGVQSLVFVKGFLGMFFLVLLLLRVDHIDGEWFGERTPLLISTALWISTSACVALRCWQSRRKAAVAPGLHEPS